MLSIGKLNASRVNYYVELVATDDYYAGPGEEPGEWAGRLAETFGCEGRVDADAFRRLMAGHHPTTGMPVVANAGRPGRLPGFDLTFSAPKSVSVLWALSDPRIASAVATAHDRAVTDVIAMIETEATTARRGHDGLTRIPGQGIVAGLFRHRTSRAGDPQLHTHVVIANLTVGADGRTTALDGRDLFHWSKTVSYAYQASLRANLTETLGVGWGPVDKGIAEIIGIPKPVRDVFSQRRSDIEAELGRLGMSSAKSAQTATLSTRPVKDRATTLEALHAEWADRAAAQNIRLERTVSFRPRKAPTLDVTGRLVAPTGLTAQATFFDRRAAYRAVCEAHRDGITPTVAGGQVDRLVEHRDVVPLGGTEEVPVAGRRYTTRELLAVEQRMVGHAKNRADAGAGVAGRKDLVLAMAERPSLTDEQQMMVTRLCTTGAGVEVVIGKAGAGKTYALDTARAAWQAAGHTVIGTAVAAKAAAGLQAGAGIPSTTLASLLNELDRPEGGLRPRTVLVVDEAGMVGTRQLDRLLTHAEHAGAKVVLVGDHRQLPEIDAGGGLAALAKTVPCSTLSANRRQEQEWERAALDQLRSGNVGRAVVAYVDNRRLTLAADADTARSALVSDWWAARRARPWETVAMYATTRDDVTDLNRRARQAMRAAGELDGPDQMIAGRPFAVGDTVICLRNDRRLGVRNGSLARLAAIGPDGTVTIQLPDQPADTVLPAQYIEDGHLGHGYATTIHKAQGQTVDRAFLLGSDQLYREAGYVGLSRAKVHAQLYMVDPDQAHDLAEPAGMTVRPPATGQPAPPDIKGELTRLLNTSRAQTLATSQTPDLDGTRAALLADPPPWAATHLGPPPVAGPARQRWADAALRVHTYRTEHGLTSSTDVLGPEPADHATRNRWVLAQLSLTTTRARTLGQEQGLDR